MLQQLDSLLLALEAQPNSDPMLDCVQLFGNDHPIEVELGIGKGRFLIDAAQRHPEVNFFGVEWATKYLQIAQRRCLKRDLTNVLMVRADAREFVEFFLPAEAVHAYHLYFPDPWPKKRHHKRRLVNPDFIGEVVRTLSPGGLVWLATDHAEYYEAILDVLVQFPILQSVEVAWEGVATNYEDKYRERGMAINRTVLKKSTSGL